MKNLTKLMIVLFIMAGASSIYAKGQQHESDDCTLTMYQSGQQVVLNGMIEGTPHGSFLSVAGCKYPVVLQYPSNLLENERQDIPELHRDSTFDSLNQRLKENPHKPVEGSLFGRLDIAKPLPEGATVRMGYMFDKSGKSIGPYGFGSPAPIYKYRFVIVRVDSVGTNSSK